MPNFPSLPLCRRCGSPFVKGPLMTQMRLIFTDCSVHQLSVPIGIIRVICVHIFVLMFGVSENSINFALNSVTTAVV